MKRMVFVLILGFLFGGVVFGQAPANDGVEFVQLVDFNDVFGEITDIFADILKEGWAFFLTLFFVWFGFNCLKSFIDGKLEKRIAELQRRERVDQAINRAEERAEVKRQLRQDELGRSREVLEFESEYRSRELQRIVLAENESFVTIDGKRYVREMTSWGDIVGHKTLDQWCEDRDKVIDEPLAFDNNDYGKTYDSIVEKDYLNTFDGKRVHKLSGTSWEWKEKESEDLKLDKTEFEIEDEEEELEREWSFFYVEEASCYKSQMEGGIVSWLQSFGRRSREYDDDLGLDSESGFEREYGHRRGEFRGGY